MKKIFWRFKKNMTSDFEIKTNFDKYKKLFLEENSKHNLISKNDEKFLYEKHIYDSLSVKLFFEKYKIQPCKILDIGCGGGFPCVPIAMEYSDFKIVGIDSIGKKINAVKEISEKLDLKNLELICDRVENIINKEFDIILSRAVGDLGKVLTYAFPLLKRGGYFIAYKSRKAEEEINNAKKIMNSLDAEIIDVIKYTLPTEEVYERNLICIRKN